MCLIATRTVYYKGNTTYLQWTIDTECHWVQIRRTDVANESNHGNIPNQWCISLAVQGHRRTNAQIPNEIKWNIDKPQIQPGHPYGIRYLVYQVVLFLGPYFLEHCWWSDKDPAVKCHAREHVEMSLYLQAEDIAIMSVSSLLKEWFFEVELGSC